MVLVLQRCLRIPSVRIALYIILLRLWLVLIHVELRNCPVPGRKNVWSSIPVLCCESHLIFPWLKSPIIIQSPLLTSLIALCIFSLFCMVMLGQRYTTPIGIVVCHVTNLHHKASLQSASSCNCTSYAGIVSLMYKKNSSSPFSHYVFPKHHITFQSQFSICYIIVCP